MSRQREWQKRMAAEGRCIICGERAVQAMYCEDHALARQVRREERLAESSDAPPKKQTHKCSACGTIGHNARTCPAE